MLNKLAAISRNKLSPNLRKILGNASWLFADKILRTIVNPLIWVWVARYLGAEQLGIYSYALSFISLFEVLSGLGLRTIVIRDIIKEAENKYEIIGTTFALKLIGGICIILLATTAISLNQPANEQIIWLVAVFALSKIFAAFSIINLWFLSQVKSKFSTYAGSIAFIIESFAKIILIVAKAPLIAFAWVFTLESVIRTIALITAYRINKENIKAWRFSFSRAKKMLNQSWLLILAGIANTLYISIDQVMLGNISGAQEVGIYAAAVRFSQLTYFIPAIITGSVFPNLIESKVSNNKSYQDKLQKLYNWMTWASLTLAILTLIVAQPIIDLFYGREYQQSGAIFSIHIWSSLFIFWYHINKDWLVNEGLFKFSLISHTAGAVVNIFLNWLLIPKYGGIGAAIATVISYGIASYFVFFIPLETRVAARMMTLSLIFPFKKIWKIIAIKP
ncbi:MAG: flippase [Rivularia sp. (in: Bacteria)]|nr:flippase [Rivularia sp. MS3]